MFRLAGIDVFLHWSWFLIAAYVITARRTLYSSLTWNVLEYLALFLIVLMHEFGHSLACRQVGGRASQIVLWPLGGVAYVDPPQRPGATLWSIAAGPLVNVVLLPILGGLWFLSKGAGWEHAMPDPYELVKTVFAINCVLLVFNLLPIYPLDGGQIVRSLLWFVVGRARSLMTASIIGFVGVAGLIVVAILMRSPWLGILCAFILMNCWGGLMQARALARAEEAPRRSGLACPVCNVAPRAGAFWVCGRCRKPFDMFASQAVCPNCGAAYDVTRCLDCGKLSQVADWSIVASVPPRL